LIAETSGPVVALKMTWEMVSRRSRVSQNLGFGDDA